MKLTNNSRAILSSAVCAFLIWYFSMEITGNTEPWDGNIAVYLSLLAALGFICTYAFNGNPIWVYFAGYTGQILPGGIAFFGCPILGYFCEGGVNFFPIGAVFILIYSLPLLIGATLAVIVQRKQSK